MNRARTPKAGQLATTVTARYIVTKEIMAIIQSSLEEKVCPDWESRKKMSLKWNKMNRANEEADLINSRASR